MESSIMNRNITLQSLQEQVESLEKRNQFLEKELEHYKNELNSTRKILTERENLLLQLQWDEDDAEIDADAQKKKKSKERVGNEERQQIQRLRSQMKIMETALEERDTNIHKLHKELSDSKIQHQQTIEAFSSGREAPQRSKTSWGFRSSPSSSPMVFKPSYSASPISSEKHFTSVAPSPANSPALSSPNFASSSAASSTSGSPSMMEFDYQNHPKKLGKKGSIWNFKKSKSKSPIINDSNWATQSAH